MKKRIASLALLVGLAACQDQAIDPVGPGSPSFSTSEPVPGTVSEFSAQATTGGLLPEITATGKISLSVDGIGTNASSGTVEVEKPAGATVRGAYLVTAPTWSAQLANGSVKLDGVVVNFDKSAANTAGSHNFWSDVTSIVKPKVDAAGAGRVSFTVEESNTWGTDGEVLAVIFDDPNQTSDNTIVLLFGGLKSAGDDFYVSLAAPLNASDPNLILDMSLGISFGYQTANSGHQRSIVDVNAQRLTSSAGGQDDGAPANGALLTVGGLDDSNSNPDPNAISSPAGFRTDDELYDLKPFVNDGDTQIHVKTSNPSFDDNVFFAAFFMTVKGQVTIEPPTNQAPVADAGADQIQECVDHDGASVTLDGSASSDADGDALTYEWFSGTTKIADGATASVTLPKGTHTITLVVTDPSGASSTDEVVVTVQDTTAPTVALSATPDRLWPPNHKYVTIAVAASATDACDHALALAGSVVSSEADNATGTGDGNTTGDIRVTRADGTVLLSSNASPSVPFNPAAGDKLEVRAERNGTGAGRTYTITFQATDASGNASTQTATVFVPHSQ